MNHGSRPVIQPGDQLGLGLPKVMENLSEGGGIRGDRIRINVCSNDWGVRSYSCYLESLTDVSRN